MTRMIVLYYTFFWKTTPSSHRFWKSTCCINIYILESWRITLMKWFNHTWSTLLRTNIPHPKAVGDDEFPFPLVGYVSSLDATHDIIRGHGLEKHGPTRDPCAKGSGATFIWWPTCHVVIDDLGKDQRCDQVTVFGDHQRVNDQWCSFWVECCNGVACNPCCFFVVVAVAARCGW